MSDFIPVCFCCIINSNLSQISSRLGAKNNVFETPEAKINKPGDLSHFISVRSRVDFLP